MLNPASAANLGVLSVLASSQTNTPPTLRNTRTRWNRAQCLYNLSGRIEGRDDYRCAHGDHRANYFWSVIQDLIPSPIDPKLVRRIAQSNRHGPPGLVDEPQIKKPLRTKKDPLQASLHQQLIIVGN
jgi:hypothetical protein